MEPRKINIVKVIIDVRDGADVFNFDAFENSVRLTYLCVQYHMHE